MAQKITITVPDNCELKQDGNTYTIVEKENKLYYNNICEALEKKYSKYITINVISTDKQAEKLLAINKLMNVAKYLNDGWQPDWDNNHEHKYCICCDKKQLKIAFRTWICNENIFFKSEELAKQAIEILGEDTVKLALCTDY